MRSPLVPILVAALVAACRASPAASIQSPSSPTASWAAATWSPAPSAATAPPRLEVPTVVLDIRAGADVTRPGTIPPGPGGSLARGPETIAVDEDGVLWLYDQAKARAVAYANGVFVRAIALADAPRSGRALLVAGRKIYLRVVDDRGKPSREIEIDALSGRTLRTADLTAAASTIYPYERVAFAFLRPEAKGVPDVLGHDGLGNRYERHVFLQWSRGQCFSVIRRITSAGADVAEACFDIGPAASDYFVARDGAVYQLEQLYTGDVLDRFAVTRVMSPAK